MLISPAYAQVAGLGDGLGGLMQFAPLVLILVIFYFLLIRPQQKKAKEHREMLSKIRRNDKIVSTGGLIGTVTRVYDDRDELIMEIAPGVKVSVRRSMVADVMAKGEPGSGRGRSKSKARDDDDEDEDDGDDDKANDNDGKASAQPEKR